MYSEMSISNEISMGQFRYRLKHLARHLTALERGGGGGWRMWNSNLRPLHWKSCALMINPQRTMINNTIIYVFIWWAASWQNQQNDCAPSEDSDQPGPMRLIWVFARRTVILLVLSWGGSNIVNHLQESARIVVAAPAVGVSWVASREMCLQWFSTR